MKAIVPVNLQKFISAAVFTHWGTVLLAALFLTIPYVPNSFLLFTDTLIVRALLIVAAVGSLYVDQLFSLLMFLLVARIFIERNNRKLLEAKAVITNNSVRQDTVLPDVVGEIADPDAHVDRRVHSPSEDGLSFLPTDDMGDNTFRPIDTSIDEKKPLVLMVEGSEAATEVFADQKINPEISNNEAP